MDSRGGKPTENIANVADDGNINELSKFSMLYPYLIYTSLFVCTFLQYSFQEIEVMIAVGQHRPKHVEKENFTV